MWLLVGHPGDWEWWLHPTRVVDEIRARHRTPWSGPACGSLNSSCPEYSACKSVVVVGFHHQFFSPFSYPSPAFSESSVFKVLGSLGRRTCLYSWAPSFLGLATSPLLYHQNCLCVTDDVGQRKEAEETRIREEKIPPRWMSLFLPHHLNPGPSGTSTY